jgi:hypothetical protein
MSVDYRLDDATVEPSEEASPPPARDLLTAAVGPELAQRLLFALAGRSSARAGWEPAGRLGGADS